MTFKIKAGYHLKRLTAEIMKLLWSTKLKKTKEENGENVPHLEITEVILVHHNIVDNDLMNHESRVLYIRLFLGQLIVISPKNFIFLKLFNSEVLCIGVRFTD